MKKEVILRILTQESLKSELQLRRYGEKKLRGFFFVISGKWLGVFLEIFQKPGVFPEFLGLQLDYKETEGALCKFPRIIDFWIYFSMENHDRLSPWLMDQCRVRSTVDRPRWPATELDGAWPSGRSEAWCTGSPSQASPGRGRQCGDRATAVKKRWRRRSVRAALGRGEKRRRVGRGATKTGQGIALL
jgi:hypothetical protein